MFAWSNGIECEDNGNYLNSVKTIQVMLSELGEEQYFCMLNDYQLEFIESIKSFFNIKEFLTDKQFKWLCIYYNIAASSECPYDDPEYYEHH